MNKPTYEELQAMIERFSNLISEVIEEDGNKFYVMGTDWGCAAIAALSETPAQSLVAIKAQWQAEAVGELGNWLCTDLERDLAKLQIIHGIVSTDYAEKVGFIKMVATKIHWYIDNVLQHTGANK